MAKKVIPVQNDVPEYGQARYTEPRQRAFGVLGFDDRPEAKIGGELIRKDSTEIDHQQGGAGG